jgi:hypothetical protein
MSSHFSKRSISDGAVAPPPVNLGEDRPLTNLISASTGKKLMLTSDLINQENALVGKAGTSSALVSIATNPNSLNLQSSDFLVEKISEHTFLISDPGKFVMSGKTLPSRTSIFATAFSPSRDFGIYWELTPVPLNDGFFYIKNKAAGGYLKANAGGTDVELSLLEAGDMDRTYMWSFRAAGKADAVVPDGNYKIRLDRAKDSLVTSFNGGARIKKETNATTTDNKTFFISYVGAGFYTISDSTKLANQEMISTTINFEIFDRAISTVGDLSYNQGLYYSFIALKAVPGINPQINPTAFQIYSYQPEMYKNSATTNVNMPIRPWVFAPDAPVTSGGAKNLILDGHTISNKTTWALEVIGNSQETAPGKLRNGYYQISNLADPSNRDLSNNTTTILPLESGGRTTWQVIYGGAGNIMMVKPSWDSVMVFGDNSLSKIAVNNAFLRGLLMRPMYKDDGAFWLYNPTGNNPYVLYANNGYSLSRTPTAGNEYKFISERAPDPTATTIRRGYYRIQDIGGSTNSTSVLRILHRFNSGNLDVSPGAPETGERTSLDFLTDHWLVEPVGSDYYRFVNRRTLRALRYDPNVSMIGKIILGNSTDELWKGSYVSLANDGISAGMFTSADPAAKNASGLRSRFTLRFSYIEEAEELLDTTATYAIKFDTSKPDSIGASPYEPGGISQLRDMSLDPDIPNRKPYFSNYLTSTNFKNHQNQSDLWKIKYVGGGLYTINHPASLSKRMLLDGASFSTILGPNSAYELRLGYNKPEDPLMQYVAQDGEASRAETMKVISRFAFLKDHALADKPAEEGYYYMTSEFDPKQTLKVSTVLKPTKPIGLTNITSAPPKSGITDLTLEPVEDSFPYIDLTKTYRIWGTGKKRQLFADFSKTAYSTENGANGYYAGLVSPTANAVKGWQKMFRFAPDSLGFYNIYTSFPRPGRNTPMMLDMAINVLDPALPATTYNNGQTYWVVRERTTDALPPNAKMKNAPSYPGFTQKEQTAFSIEFSNTANEYGIIYRMLNLPLDSGVVSHFWPGNAVGVGGAIPGNVIPHGGIKVPFKAGFDADLDRTRWIIEEVSAADLNAAGGEFVNTPPTPPATPRKVTAANSDPALNLDKFNVYPVPASNELNIGLVAKKGGSIAFTLTDILGRTVYRKTVQISEGKQTINLQNLSSFGIINGIYILRATGLNGDLDEQRKILFEPK